jgi:DNA sulfur modification protein DndB
VGWAAGLELCMARRTQLTKTVRRKGNNIGEISVPFVSAIQHGKSFFLTALSAADVVQVSYVARRGVNDEEGAVQRLLNPTRIAGIRDFVLAGGTFPVSIVLNWSDPGTKPTLRSGKLVLQRSPQSAQIIDGQHRVIGLAAAIEKKKSLASMQLPVTLYTGLTTKECADIFLAINTEQKPVHRSLVFDLYQVASDYVVDPAALRAGDLASDLNEHPDSPFTGYIKFPGAPAGQKGLALSTVVSAVKPLVEEKGVFEQVGLSQLQMQSQFIMNFFNVLRNAYGAEWESPSNVFRMAAGFVGALDFVKNKLVVHCNISGDFTFEAIEKVMKLTPGSLIRRDSIEGLQGRRAFNFVSGALESLFDPTEGKNRKIRV